MSDTLLILSVLPSVLLGRYIYKKDVVEKESRKLLTKLIIVGVLSTFTTLIITLIVSSIFPVLSADESSLDLFSLAVHVFFGIAIIEEFSKWIWNYFVSWKNEEFNYLYDAIVYSVFVSLGFATFENILYVFEGALTGIGYTIALYRMVLAVPAHAFFGVTMGYYLGLAKLLEINGDKDKSSIYKLLSVIMPTTYHFLYDYLIMANLEGIFYLFVIYLYIVSFRKVKKISSVTTNLFGNNDNAYGIFGNSNGVVNYEKK